MIFNLKSVTPSFGHNYQTGWCFASFRDNSKTSAGIAWLTRYDQQEDLPVSHVGLVKDARTVVEAVMGEGVKETPISEYFDDPHVHIYFRKPIKWSPTVGQLLIAQALSQIGKKYDEQLIRAHLGVGSMIGHAVNELTGQRFEDWLCSLLNTKDAWICSELCAWSMQQLTVYSGKGCLSRPACTITPPEFVWDKDLFGPLDR